MRKTSLTRRACLALALSASSTALAAAAAGLPSREGADRGPEPSQDGSATPEKRSADITSVSPDDPYGTGVHHASIEVADYGTIEVALNANVAPVTVSNFCDLAGSGFYDGLTFHRVIKGFMIQGGDPNADGTGGSDKTIVGEFSSNGVENSIPHVRGTISMARATEPDSASSQFFIMQEDNDSLDGQYAGFGNVTSGMEVVDAICDRVAVEDSNGTVARENQPVITSIRVVD